MSDAEVAAPDAGGGELAEQWVPFGLSDSEVNEYTALREDIPQWLVESIWNWIRLEFTATNGTPSRIPVFRTSLVQECERALRVTIPLGTINPYHVDDCFLWVRSAYRDRDAMAVWRLVDYLLGANYRPGSQALEKILVDSGSAWTVGTRLGKPGLVPRLPEGVLDAAQDVFARGDSGRRLSTAWESAFGLDPDPEVAYSRAVKAVEDAAIPVVSPRNKSATLGTVIAAIRDDGKFSLPNLREHKDAPTHDVLLSMLQMLWTGQHDRHGGPSAVSVPNVTQAEAEAAVLLAVTLVGWFETGKVQK